MISPSDAGSNPTRSTRTFSLPEKFHQKRAFSPSNLSGVQASCSAADLLGTIARYDDSQINDHLKDFAVLFDLAQPRQADGEGAPEVYEGLPFRLPAH